MPSAPAIPAKRNTDLVTPLRERGFEPLAQIRPRHARDITDSPWSIGCETIDRDYVDFSQTGPHLGELGAKQARLQGGWAKCDRGDGKFNWQWLDDVVVGCLAQGVKPWIETCYGNPAYEGGGGIGLAEGIPVSAQALQAWDRWVTALVERYAERVDSWEIWNEPDNGSAVPAQAYTAFFIRTATLLRQVQPKAHIIGLALAGNQTYAQEFLKGLAEQSKTDLLNEVTFHFYPHNPDDSFDAVNALNELLKRYAPHVTLRQGETGAPSETRQFMALGKHEWSPRKQAAWNTRRLLAHHARGIPMSLFQLADMYYSKKKGLFEGHNPKGLLAINPDKTVSHRKPSYFAAQHVFALFDNRFELRALTRLEANAPWRTEAYGWTPRGDDAPSMVAWWRADDAPALETLPLESISLAPVVLKDPVLIDLMSGTVFSLPASAAASVWSHLPCSDMPLLLASKAMLPLQSLEVSSR